MKILLFGSSFNPPHIGHLSLIRAAVAVRCPDIVFLVPTGIPAHKAAAVCPARLRLLMTDIICGEIEGARVLDYELTRRTKSFTIDTVRHIRKIYKDCEIELLIGSDMLLYLEEWHEYEKLLQQCTIIVAVRQESDRRAVADYSIQLADKGAKIISVDAPTIEISSTEIRRLCQMGGDFFAYVLPQISKIITENKLYLPISHKKADAVAKKMLSEKRYHHTKCVEKMALRLAVLYGANRYKTSVAALLHDIMKEQPKEKMLQIVANNDILDNIPFAVWHGYAAAEYAKQCLDILDEEILSAIRFHSSGKADMSLLDKIIFLADMVSEDREYKEAEIFWKMALEDLNAAVKAALTQNVLWLLQDEKDIDKNSLDAIAGL